MQLQLAGLASGFDWKSMIDQLMAAERYPQQRMRADQSTNTKKVDALELLDGKLDKLKSIMGDFSDGALYHSKKTSYSDDALGITATASTSALEGNFAINVTQLATVSKRMGSTDVGGTIGSTATVLSSLNLATDITEGNFTVNGQEVSVLSTDSLQDVFDAISAATGGVVTASYDGIADKVTLTSSSGQLEIGATSDTSNFLSALKLDQMEVVDAGGGASSVTSTGTLGVVDLANSIATSGLGVTGAGTITINGVSIDFDADTESMSALMAKVNDSAAGVTMSYDSAADQFRIVNKETGALTMPIIDSGNGLLAATGLDGASTVGKDLQYSIDGGATISSRSNVITEVSHGISGVTITASELGFQTIGISKETGDLEKKINSFISAYNDVQDFIHEKTKITVADEKVTAADLAGNREITGLDSDLRALAFDAIAGMGGNIFRLEHMGIDFRSDTSKLEIKDSAAFEAALADPSILETFFTGDVDGDGDTDESFVTRMEDFIENFTKDDGILDTQVETLTNQNKKIDEQIVEMERRLEFTKAALEASFIAMERAQANIQQQTSALASLKLPGL